MIKTWGIRNALIGDTIMALPALEYFKKLYPDSYVYFSIAKKCAQAAPLYFNHPLVDRIKITDHRDSYGASDLDIIKRCAFVFNCSPEHRDQKWYNHFNCLEETWQMAGWPIEAYHSVSEPLPRLYRWWDKKSYGKRHIALWPIPAYGGGNMSRCPSVKQWEEIISILVRKGYMIHHFGWHQEPVLGLASYANHTNESFIEQVQNSLNCDLILGCDSGATWATAAYHDIPQINLLVMSEQHGHTSNPLAFEPKGPKSSSIVVEKSWENLNIEEVVERVDRHYD